ncbi:HAD hydrolase-like protein, partial [Bacillus pumilus]|uniref:HAD hydrolase-like protein n=1 Tax=Bacillus pumilus TaxID=1408 RepID=UPI0021B36130
MNTLLFHLHPTLINTNQLIIPSFQHTLHHYYPPHYTREQILHFIPPSLFHTFSPIHPHLTHHIIHIYPTFN